MPKVTHATVTVNSNQITVMYYSVFMMVNLYSAREAALIPLKCFLNAFWDCHRAEALVQHLLLTFFLSAMCNYPLLLFLCGHILGFNCSATVIRLAFYACKCYNIIIL